MSAGIGRDEHEKLGLCEGEISGVYSLTPNNVTHGH